MSESQGRFLRKESGATVVEYAVLASLIAAVVVVVVAAVGNDVKSKFEFVRSEIVKAKSGS